MGAHTLTAFALGAPDRVAGLVAIGPVALGRALRGGAHRLGPPRRRPRKRRGRGLPRRLRPRPRSRVARGAAADRARAPPPPPTPRSRRAGAARGTALTAVRGPRRSWSSSTCPPSWSPAMTRPIPVIPTRSPRPGRERLPRARLISEDAGASPLAWQGGKLSREIAGFCREPGGRRAGSPPSGGAGCRYRTAQPMLCRVTKRDMRSTTRR